MPTLCDRTYPRIKGGRETACKYLPNNRGGNPSSSCDKRGLRDGQKKEVLFLFSRARNMHIPEGGGYITRENAIITAKGPPALSQIVFPLSFLGLKLMGFHWAFPLLLSSALFNLGKRCRPAAGEHTKRLHDSIPLIPPPPLTLLFFI